MVAELALATRSDTMWILVVLDEGVRNPGLVVSIPDS